MTGANDIIKLNVIYYGTFSFKQKTTLQFQIILDCQRWAPRQQWLANCGKLVANHSLYLDLHNTPLARCIVLGRELTDSYSMGKDLKQSDIQALVLKAMKQKDFTADARSMYLILTADDVLVEKFCMSMCGTHFFVFPAATGWFRMDGCPGLCSWTYAPGGLVKKALIPPNGDAGIHGMIITLSNILASMATNPYNSGYFQQGSGLEACGACQGIFGTGSFSGYPGELLTDSVSKASYNRYGASNAKFLVPWIWHPSTRQCAGQA
ncbi:hypothetical protein Mapa_017557 [Marchantia paleacea]|nr:hypothetical protein Mapa_017557 [Marchantia paleacea]